MFIVVSVPVGFKAWVAKALSSLVWPDSNRLDQQLPVFSNPLFFSVYDVRGYEVEQVQSWDLKTSF